jgi:hypothetical protein
MTKGQKCAMNHLLGPKGRIFFISFMVHLAHALVSPLALGATACLPFKMSQNVSRFQWLLKDWICLLKDRICRFASWLIML